MDTPSWPAAEIQHSERDLCTLRSLLVSMVEEDPFDQRTSYFANLLLIRSCGHLEIAEQYCVESFFGQFYGSLVASYLDCTAFYQGRNPSPDKLKNFLEQVDHQNILKGSLTDHLEARFEGSSGIQLGNKTKNAALKALVDARNAVVHGESMSFDVKVALDLADLAIDIAGWYEKAFAPGGLAEQTHQLGRSSDLSTINGDKRQKAIDAMPQPTKVKS